MRTTKPLSFALMLLAFALLTASQVRADGTSIDYVYQANGNTFTWQLPTNPVVDPSNAYSGSDFTLTGVFVSENGGAPQDGALDFFNTAVGGGFGLFVDNFGSILIDSFGPQLYSGDEGTPTFLTGTFTLSDYGASNPFDPNSISYSGTLQATTSSVPEPSTVLLLGVGLAAGLAISLLRKN